jgi:hypothetical protein
MTMAPSNSLSPPTERDQSAQEAPATTQDTTEHLLSKSDANTTADTASPSDSESRSPTPEVAAAAKALGKEPSSAKKSAGSGDGTPPPLPKEPVPQSDDGWDCHWDQGTQAWFFHNRFTNQTTWENPRIVNPNPTTTTPSAAAPGSTPKEPTPAPPTSTFLPSDKPAAGGYNPAIHGDYDPNAWYAKGTNPQDETLEDQTATALLAGGDPYASTATFNRFTGQFQGGDSGPERHSDESKSRRQMNAFFDVDAAANAHDGRSLKAERSGKKPTKAELKAFKEKRRARKEEKRRAWLRD